MPTIDFRVNKYTTYQIFEIIKITYIRHISLFKNLLQSKLSVR